MPSILDLFGELSLKTDKFDRSLKSSVAQMQSADAQLNKVISSSNKLGDTSATVARRYEKLSDGIATQKNRLVEAAKAFESGDINAKKFQTTIDSVSRSVEGLNSRIKDAKARVTELNDTGFTHFQNQIRGGVTGQQSNDLFGRLSGYQKTQLSFQANDIISGLAMGQSPLQILAQQGGQIVQIFQQGKTEATGLATATTAASAASKELAVSSQATAVAMGEASAATTILGYSVVGIGATLAAGLVTILAAKKASEDILKSAQDRLKLEEAITAQFNKQNMAVADLKKRLATEAGGRRFDQLLQSDNLPGLQQTANDIQRTITTNLQAIADEQATRREVIRRAGTSGEAARSYLKGADESKEQEELRKQQENQISRLYARMDELRNPSFSGVDWYTKIQQQQREALKGVNSEALKAEKDFAAERKKMIDESIRQAKEFAAYVKDLRTQDNKKFDTALGSLDLRTSAKEFEQGYRNAAKSQSGRLQDQLGALLGREMTERIIGFAEGGAGGRSAITRGSVGYGSALRANREEQSALDQAIIKITDALDPAQLTRDQRDVAAAARRREADKRDEDTKEINKKLLEALKNPKVLDVVVTDMVGVGIGTSGNVNARYLRR